MQVDSELLGSCGLILEKEIFSQDGYSLSRVIYRGKKLVAEISSSGGTFQHRWPSVRGLLTPVSSRDLPGGKKLLLFSTGEGLFLTEKLHETGGYQEDKALDVCRKVLRILTDLQSAGMICGYLGPEMFLLEKGEPLLVAGRRGVPVSPFTPQEVDGSRPSDPRSDVSALGSLLFRLIAGTDNREEQLLSWNKLSLPLQKTVQTMVAADPVNRPGSLKAVSEMLTGLYSGENEPGEKQEKTASLPHTDSFLRKEPSLKKSVSKKRLWYIGVPVVALLAYLAFTFSGFPGKETPPGNDLPRDTAEVEHVDAAPVPSPWAEDSTAAVEPIPGNADLLLADTARVWVSNCTGVPDMENSYRAGPLSGFSFVYPVTGTTRRRTSLITVRRENPLEEYSESDLWQTAEEVAGTDTGFTVKPVDLTVMLGTDLRYAGVNGHFLPLPAEAPAETLFVDVVNHGIQYKLDGLGAAAYAGQILNGRSCTLEDVIYTISVIDIRDADRYNEEIGIPESLEETIFIFHRENTEARTLEQLVRQYIQALPAQGAFPLEGVPIPHLHILIGESSAD